MITGFNHSGYVVDGRWQREPVAFQRADPGSNMEREADIKEPPNRTHTGTADAHYILSFVGTRDEHFLECVHATDRGGLNGHLERNQLGYTHFYFNVEDLDGFTSD